MVTLQSNTRHSSSCIFLLDRFQKYLTQPCSSDKINEANLVHAAGDDDRLPLAHVDAGDGPVVKRVAQDGELGDLGGAGRRAGPRGRRYGSI